MTIDLLDLLLIAHFCFKTECPWWLWVLGVLSTVAGNVRLKQLCEPRPTINLA